ncbi:MULTISPECIES: zinc-dependent alcohol dehydrogenase family protein [unclassified Pseudomonas]|uniref:zinc-dependent alcohol dehydrogenase family protein n=1 Tax=unclassified Pseudomonas TaxID=196821 RepID=UPI002AC8F8C8|nr:MULTISPECIES: zinc-dependent alcohol dehydrogenase family protein [unclassified Pseudomonas]MEB0047604.1 zinc-dependent alcohol dehydrogenase family protein [Pseudomonas sp. Dout3]MEB0098914.1 zinc-dependent alcohol dehydrogenase family protein [Pseudomonas sp. DC1.2]WPX58053.1 zinc-dependent alcohol dehydrogenase family protein [Pseudomonas sp. DC1.2]
MSSTMRALILNDYATGYFTDTRMPRPEAGPGQVLVRVVASGVNPIDYKIRTGNAPYAMPDLPAIIGTDLAGVVEALGPGVTRFALGDEVFGLTGGVRGLQGSLAEYAAVDADLLAHKPSNISLREAAAMPLVFLTAWEGLVDRVGVKAGQRVLVHGGAGGVGHAAVQIAKAMGAEVFTTVSAGKKNIVESYGATAIDYNASRVADYVEAHTAGQGFDVIYDTVGGASLDASFEAIAHYGHIASCAAFAQHSLAVGSLRCATLSGVFVLLPMLSGIGRAHHGDILKQAAQMVEQGTFKPLLDAHRYSLADAHAAHDAVQSGSAVGKVVIDIA